MLDVKIKDTNFPDTNFDYFEILAVIEYVTNQETMIREIHKVLKPKRWVCLPPQKRILSF